MSRASDGRLGRILYRQLIRWCKTTDKALPLSSVVPPVTLKPPHVEEESLKKLASPPDAHWKHVSQLLPPKSMMEENQITIPIHTSKDAERLFKVVFRMNADVSSPELLKLRTSVAFDALKSLSELTRGLRSLKHQREKHLDRTGVHYHIGQVVQHKTERWRGVITGWQREEKNQSNKTSSLTKKDYGEGEEVPAATDDVQIDCEIHYTMILDSGDAHLLGGASQLNSVTGAQVAMQSELEEVQDECLIRIRSSWIERHFDRFDSLRRCFVPNECRAFEYPLDNLDYNDAGESAETQRRNEFGKQIVSGVQQFASRLDRLIQGATSPAKSCGLGLLASFQDRLSSLAKGDIVPDSAFLSAKDLSHGDLASYHLRHVLDLTMELADLLWIRRISKEEKERIRFSLGEVVQHKKYGFRGVIVAWDPKPAVDISRWDGLGDIENASDLPFYHIVPDQGDCIEAFGGERPFRYVCEANLEPCPRERSFIDVDLEPGWERTSANPEYSPPVEIQFKYGEYPDDEGLTASCLTAIMNEISRLQVSLRKVSDDKDTELADIAKKLSLDTMFAMLKLSDTMESAVVFEETIKEIWKAHENQELRLKLDNGVADLLRGNKERALDTFTKLVEDDPDYAEAWNKASTCHFMLGDMQLSLEMAERTLMLLPRHFQAMNGLGLVHCETRKYKLGARLFRQSLALDPWSPVSARLAVCKDMLHGADLEEQGASQDMAPYKR